MRSMSGPGLLAARGRIAGVARTAVLLAAAGELVADKLPMAIDRTAPPALAGRIATAAYTGYAVAGAATAAGAAATAGLGTFATWRLRAWVVERTGLPDPLVAVGEDALALGAAALATRGLSR
jgi:uncharacterized membrane protein